MAIYRFFSVGQCFQALTLCRYGHLNPINFLEGIQRNKGWIKSAKLDTEVDYLKYIERLEAIPRQVRWRKLGLEFFSGMQWRWQVFLELRPTPYAQNKSNLASCSQHGKLGYDRRHRLDLQGHLSFRFLLGPLIKILDPRRQAFFSENFLKDQKLEDLMGVLGSLPSNDRDINIWNFPSRNSKQTFWSCDRDWYRRSMISKISQTVPIVANSDKNSTITWFPVDSPALKDCCLNRHQSQWIYLPMLRCFSLQYASIHVLRKGYGSD